MVVMLKHLVTLIVLFGQVSGDYECICNYNVEKEVYSVTDSQTTPIGYLYEFDCKPKLALTGSNVLWVSVAFEHQIGYVQSDAQVQSQICPGKPSDADVLPTSNPQMTNSSRTTHAATTGASGTFGQTQPDTTSPIVTSSASQSTLRTKTSTTSTTTRPQTADTTTRATTTISSTTASTATSTTTKPTTTPPPQPTTTSPPSSTTSSQPTPPTSSLTSAAVSSTSTPFSIGDTSLCSASTLQFSSSHRGTTGQFVESCYVIVPQIQHWNQAEQTCSSVGGHLVDITSSTEQEFIYNFLQSQLHHSAWIGLNDIQSESRFQWSSGTPLGYTNWAVHDHFSDSFEDCVVMDLRIHNGKWDDRECSFESYSYICEFVMGGTQPASTQISVTSAPGTSTTDGNTALCPSMVQSHAASHGAILAQYGKSCYELLMNSRMSWEHAENLCSYNGGHLAHVTNSKEQAFIDGFMARHNPSHAVWIGLHDKVNEGSFQWTSGVAVQYTNWINGHVDNTQGGHNSEDCVTLVPQRAGKWDDVTCGYENMFGFGPDSGEVHYAFCQYSMHPSQALIG